MALITLQDVTFHYPDHGPTLQRINLAVEDGEFLTIIGQSGCGKSTLLRLLKQQLMPEGELQGNILYDGIDIQQLDPKRASSEVGYVMQNPHSQIVAEFVWSELAFGLENLGVPQQEIRRRVAEIANFFGIESWFHEKTEQLSGGQKQLLNLASILVMQPKVLLLDEPTAQLDPIATSEFLQTLRKIHEEFGTTIIIVEHNLEELLQYTHRIALIETGRLEFCGSPQQLAYALINRHPLQHALPAPMYIAAAMNSDAIPMTIQQGQKWLKQFPKKTFIPKPKERSNQVVLKTKNVAFQYEKFGRQIVKDLNITICAGDIYTIIGGNGSGKSTTLALLTRLLKPKKGSVYIHGKKINTYKDSELYGNLITSMPQDPKLLFSAQTVAEEVNDLGVNQEFMQQLIEQLELTHVFQQHPYDLSGGEQQKLALVKVLHNNAPIIVLDEPTKGLDVMAKQTLGECIKTLQQQGKTIIVVTHDIQFAASYSSRCALFFDGTIISEDDPHTFFSENYFYTTAAHKLSRHQFQGAILVEEVIQLCK